MTLELKQTIKAERVKLKLVKRLNKLSKTNLYYAHNHNYPSTIENNSKNYKNLNIVRMVSFFFLTNEKRGLIIIQLAFN